MDAKHYERLKEAADLEHRLNVEAIERVRRMEEAFPQSGGDDAETDGDTGVRFKRNSNKVREASAGNGKILSAVRTAVADLEGNFRRQDVEDRIKVSHPAITVKAGSLKSAMNRLVEAGELEVVVKAQGRRPAVYKRSRKE